MRSTDLSVAFNRKLREAKTPRQTYQLFSRYFDKLASRIGTLTFQTLFPQFINQVGTLRHADKFYVRRNSRTVGKLSKKTAKLLFNYVHETSWKTLPKLDKLVTK